MATQLVVGHHPLHATRSILLERQRFRREPRRQRWLSDDRPPIWRATPAQSTQRPYDHPGTRRCTRVRLVDRSAWIMACCRGAPAERGETGARRLVGWHVLVSALLLDDNIDLRVLRCHPREPGHGHLVLDDPWYWIGSRDSPSPSRIHIAKSTGQCRSHVASRESLIAVSRSRESKSARSARKSRWTQYLRHLTGAGHRQCRMRTRSLFRTDYTAATT